MILKVGLLISVEITTSILYLRDNRDTPMDKQSIVLRANNTLGSLLTYFLLVLENLFLIATRRALLVAYACPLLYGNLGVE